MSRGLGLATVGVSAIAMAVANAPAAKAAAVGPTVTVTGNEFGRSTTVSSGRNNGTGPKPLTVAGPNRVTGLSEPAE